jgi:hypothetical protein
LDKSKKGFEPHVDQPFFDDGPRELGGRELKSKNVNMTGFRLVGAKVPSERAEGTVDGVRLVGAIGAGDITRQVLFDDLYDLVRQDGNLCDQRIELRLMVSLTIKCWFHINTTTP